MNTETTPDGALSDEDLAKIAYEAWNTSGVPWESHIISGNALRSAKWITIARAVRAALLPEVAPLRPGETVTIRDCALAAEALTIEFEPHSDYLLIDAQTADNEPLALDAAGVRALIETCRRWLVDTGSLY